MVYLITNKPLKYIQNILIPFPIIILNALQRKGYIHFLPYTFSLKCDMYCSFIYVFLYVTINLLNLIQDLTETLHIKVFTIPYIKED